MFLSQAFSMILLLLGLFSSLTGIMFLVGSFMRVDSSLFIDHADGNKEKIAKLHSLQASWDKLGKYRQFLASSPAFLILGISLLLAWYDRSFSQYYFIVPIIYAINFLSLFYVNKYAKAILTSESHGDSQVLGVIKLNMRLCITLAIVYVVLVAKT
jgi:hypothetical protein